MKALSIRQPWSGAVALGWKDVENRGHMIQHRGDVLIHAGGNFASNFTYAADTIRQITDQELPTFGAPTVSPAWSMGAIVGVATIRAAHRGCDGSCSPWAEPGLVHHMLVDARPLKRAVPAPGRLYLWTPDRDVLDEVREVWPR
jgi:hypothetical protein